MRNDESKEKAIRRAGLPRGIGVYVSMDGAYGPVAVFSKELFYPISKRARQAHALLLRAAAPHLEALRRIGGVRVPHINEEPDRRPTPPLTSRQVAAILSAVDRSGLKRGPHWNGEGSHSFSVTVWTPQEYRSNGAQAEG